MNIAVSVLFYLIKTLQFASLLFVDTEATLVDKQRCTYRKHGKRVIQKCFTLRTSTSTSTKSSTNAINLGSLASSIAYQWKFNGDISDSITGTNLALISGSYSFIPNRNGVANRAIYINTATFSFIGPIMGNTNTFAVGSWIYETSYIWWAPLIGSNIIPQPWYRRDYSTEMVVVISMATGGSPSFSYPDVTGLQSAVSNTSYVIPLNTWTHILYSTGGNTVRFFVNGALYQEFTNTIQFKALTTSQYTYLFGASWIGNIDNLIVLYRHLTVAEASYIMNMD